jgi:ketosteroid isomerase-like protein
MRSKPSLKLRAAAIATAATLALGAAACGGDDDNGDTSAAKDRQQARAAVESLYAAIADGDAERVCEHLNENAQKQLAAGALGGEQSGTCAESFQGFLDQAEEAGGLDLTLKAKVQSVTVTGDTAVAKVTFGNDARKGDIPLEKVDGEWKLEAAGATPSQ